MKAQRSIVEILELWGEWERVGRNYTKHLQPQSERSLGFPPQLNDDEAVIICRKMAIIKTQSPYNYRILKMRYMNECSIVRMKTYLKVGQDRCYELIAVAEFYAEEVIFFEEKTIASQVRQC
jgi:hypothetical protein